VQQVMAMTWGPQLDAETIAAVEGGFANGGYQKVPQKRQREESERLAELGRERERQREAMATEEAQRQRETAAERRRQGL
jgi:hypothetical protein